MLELLKRSLPKTPNSEDENQVSGFLGEGLPPNAPG
jgi:hypothetical protein